MDLGHWDTAIIRSVFVSSLLLPAFYLIHIGGFQVSEIPGMLVIFSLYIGVFLLASIAGWVVVGLPVHWLACKYNNTGYLSYLILPITFLLISGISNGPWFFGVTAFIQAFIFRHFVFKGTA